jgi:II/X family phage/plasmid replication protein
MYPTTVYFGKKDSRHKGLKIYLKYPELLNYTAELKKRNRDGRGKLDEAIKINSSHELIEFTKGLIRFEATLKKRWLQDRCIPILITELNNFWKKYKRERVGSLWQKLHKEAFNDLYKTFDGGGVMDYSDEGVREILKSKYATVRKNGRVDYSKALRAFRFYRSIASEGYNEIQATTPSSTFYRLVSMLRGAGISLAQLQNLHHIKSNVVPVIRLIKMDYSKQRPANYVEPVSGLNKPRIALVS